MRTILWLLGLILLFLTPTRAHAGTYTTKVCFAYDVEWWPTGLEAGDRWTTNAVRPSRGLWYRLITNTGSQSTVTEAFTPWNGQDPLVNRSTAYDWARFWWDMATDEGVPIGDLADLYDNMELRDADPDDNFDADHDCGSTLATDDVVTRLLDAGVNTPCGLEPDCVDEVADQRNNGQHH